MFGQSIVDLGSIPRFIAMLEVPPDGTIYFGLGDQPGHHRGDRFPSRSIKKALLELVQQRVTISKLTGMVCDEDHEVRRGRFGERGRSRSGYQLGVLRFNF